MKPSLLAVAALACLTAVTAMAADVSGSWIAQIPGRDGATIETTFALKAAGEKLTGTVSNQFGDREISDGKVTGDDVTFTVNIEFNGNQFSHHYTGKAAGNEIKFKRERKGGEFGPPMVEFVAKRK
jgi:hypothetical protein